MTKTICDICEKEMPPSKFVDTSEELNFCISSRGIIWDICDDCRVSLAKWMTMQKKERTIDKWQKLKGFLTDGKEHITKNVYVSRPSVYEEILDIMEESEKRELSEPKGDTDDT